jgi:hypothetical protein
MREDVEMAFGCSLMVAAVVAGVAVPVGMVVLAARWLG